MTIDLKRFSKLEIKHALWDKGELDWMLHAGQKSLSKDFQAATGRKFVACCSRRWGKSYWFCVEAIKAALKKPKSQIRYAAPTAKMVKQIIDPHMASILETCPEHLKPKHASQEGLYHFPNGSQIHVAGCDNGGGERLRGVGTHLALVDEAGFIDDLEYLVQSILLPQTVTTGGRILLASTPPISPAHAFRRYFVEAMAAGTGVHKTVYDAPHITPAMVEEFIIESGGETSSTWRREFLAEFVTDDASAVVPEWSDANVVDEYPFPPEAACYVSMDVGYTDLTVAVFAVYDFITATLYVVDEYVTSKATSDVIDAGVEHVERRAFEKTEPKRRVVDAPPIVVADIRKRASRSWISARKDNKDAALNALRVKIQNGQVKVHRRCKTTIAHLQAAVWNKARTSYERSGTHGHFDAVDACVYLVRHVDWQENPATPHRFAKDEFFVRQESKGLVSSLRRHFKE